MNAHFLVELFPTCPIYCLTTPNARAAQDLPMGRAKSFPTSYSILVPNPLRNGVPISLIKQGGNYGSFWNSRRNCSPANLRITEKRRWF